MASTFAQTTTRLSRLIPNIFSINLQSLIFFFILAVHKMNIIFLLIGLSFVATNQARPMQFIQVKDELMFCGSYAADRSVKNSTYGKLCLQNVVTKQLYLTTYSTADSPKLHQRLNIGFDQNYVYFLSVGFVHLGRSEYDYIKRLGMTRYNIADLKSEFTIPTLDFNKIPTVRDSDIRRYDNQVRMPPHPAIFFPPSFNEGQIESLPFYVTILPTDRVCFYIIELNRRLGI